MNPLGTEILWTNQCAEPKMDRKCTHGPEKWTKNALVKSRHALFIEENTTF